MIATLFSTSERRALFDPPLSAREAATAIRNGRAPAGMQVRGHLSMEDSPKLTELPADLCVDSLDLSGCTGLRALPEGLRVRRLNLSGCIGLRALPAGLSCYELTLHDTPLRSLPSDLRVEYRLDLSGCQELETLPTGLKVGSLVLENCTALRALPEGLDVCFLDISGCSRLQEWPQQATVRIGRLTARGCAQITALPTWLTELSQLDVNGCAGLQELPESLRVNSWIDLAGTGICALPASCDGANLRWRGVPIDARIAFQPETITSQEVLESRNVELRRVLLERMGYEAFLQQTQAQELDRDRDPGGERRLLRVPIPNDEALVCLSVFCPSTGRQYMLRVPPTTRTCRQAAAWIAGFDNERDYRPIAET